MNITLKNNYLMVKELVRDEKEQENSSGFIIPKETLDEEQVSQGIVVSYQKSDEDEYSKGDIVLFHRVMPVDINIKLDGDTELQSYFFVKASDIICKLTK
jgi:co-chaperonin GroES (HSP10)